MAYEVCLMSNDGQTILGSTTYFRIANITFYADRLEINDSGDVTNILVPDEYIDRMLGYATSPNSTEPDFDIGSSVLFLRSNMYFFCVLSQATTGTINITYNNTTIASTEEELPINIAYNGNTIATVDSGETKTLNCNGKVMASDVVVGSKTLNCNGKVMASNVTVTAS